MDGNTADAGQTQGERRDTVDMINDMINMDYLSGHTVAFLSSSVLLQTSTVLSQTSTVTSRVASTVEVVASEGAESNVVGPHALPLLHPLDGYESRATAGRD